jgi:cytochrome c-type biogenesis protein CcmH
MRILIVMISFFLLPIAAFAVDPGEILKDPKLEQRARSISKGLRCVVCQNQSIDDSDAKLARDLRVLVRDRIIAGDSDMAVIDYVVSRYGDFVLLRPPVKGVTLVLWLGPIIITLFGLIGLIYFFRRQRKYAQVLSQDGIVEVDN